MFVSIRSPQALRFSSLTPFVPHHPPFPPFRLNSYFTKLHFTEWVSQGSIGNPVIIISLGADWQAPTLVRNRRGVGCAGPRSVFLTENWRSALAISEGTFKEGYTQTAALVLILKATELVNTWAFRCPSFCPHPAGRLLGLWWDYSPWTRLSVHTLTASKVYQVSETSVFNSLSIR